MANEPSKMSSESNTIFIGKKPPMNYVLAVITAFNNSNNEEVILKARGQAMTIAVDAAEIARRRFLKGLTVKNVAIGTDEVQQEEGGTRNVSTIEITLAMANVQKA